MSRMPIDTRTQDAWKELIHKEASTRISWHKTYQPATHEDEWFKQGFYRQALSKPLSRVIPPPKTTTTQPVQTKLVIEQAKKPSEPTVEDMFPVGKEHLSVLFDGFSKEEKGRYKYLNLRKEIPLENRYQYPVSNSMAYGWKLGETGQKFQAPTYARGKIVEESFYRRNGVF